MSRSVVFSVDRMTIGFFCLFFRWKIYFQADISNQKGEEIIYEEN